MAAAPEESSGAEARAWLRAAVAAAATTPTTTNRRSHDALLHAAVAKGRPLPTPFSLYSPSSSQPRGSLVSSPLGVSPAGVPSAF
ncbi:hypothetical protein HPB50_017589 [Hyalomma asiaticum]|uniref:Uncharacterized protein n=1 Tax=Hyalomma asiaticum TaxID=266040 RepID=A0ACB7SNM7_HYAAI|nr:hypothetical protein HPB50_017589 [Hyalomma asiaticum]